ncbi:putative RNA-directed DNA polymerase from transposon BS [Trichonephila inaurata madagascariensis]|uniref:Putative RNA-directed DNA polymerase from transposon BS n=1 Tax=Trichonephila inaurata madagascariensis TaxID=2747483 RepID=A0A8X6YHJ6_9ARAC|nr:putative RNA-directed DNA polymerase from transposon BS [Trichonephila inaurata madagascariensis]
MESMSTLPMEKSRSYFVLKNRKPVNSLDSYRPISLISVCCKVAEKMVECRLWEFFESKGNISDCQAGFRRHRSTMNQVYETHPDHKNGFHRKQSTLAVLVDFKAAYDKVWRRMMLHKLKKRGVSGKLLHWV